MGIKENLETVNSRINAALKRSGRADDVTLVAVTKYCGIEDINTAISSGVRVIGENRIKDALAKFSGMRPVEKHMIGHLQTNKVKLALGNFDCIQTVDSIKLAEEISKRAQAPVSVMIEVNISGQEQRYGVAYEEVQSFYDKVIRMDNLEIIGLMAMAPYVPPEETRPYFRKMKSLNDCLRLEHLSMGMSNDFEVAVEEGSTMVRVGSAIFL